MNSALLHAWRLHLQLAPQAFLQPAISILQPSIWHSPQSSPHRQGHHTYKHHNTPCLRHCSSGNAQELKGSGHDVLQLPPRSLHHHDPLPIVPTDTLMGKLAKLAVLYSDKDNMSYNAQYCYQRMAQQVDDGALCNAFGMDPKVFYSTWTLLALHIWLLLNRLETEQGKRERAWKDALYKNFKEDVERRIYKAGVQMHVNKWMRKLEEVLFSAIHGFSRALRPDVDQAFAALEVGADAPPTTQTATPNSGTCPKTAEGQAARMQQVVLREFFGGDFSKTLQAEQLTRYLVYQRACLQMTETEDILGAQIKFAREPFLIQKS